MNKSDTQNSKAKQIFKARTEVRRQIRKNSVANFPFIFMNVMSTIVAAYGLLADSTAVVIGAMLIAMLLGPITGISLGLIDGNKKLLGIALLSEIAGVLCVLATAFIIGWIHSDIPAGKEITSRTAPNIIDLIIALAGGTAGAYATVSPRLSSGLIGVAISTALVPPLSVCSILLARGEYEAAFGGFLLFFANFVAIQFASSVVLWFSGFHRVTKKSEAETKQIILQNAVSFAVLIILAITLGYNFLQSAQKQNFERAVRVDLKTAIKNFQATSINDVQFKTENGVIIITAVLRTPFVFSKEQVSDIEKTLPKQAGHETELHIRSVITTETTKNGNIE